MWGLRSIENSMEGEMYSLFQDIKLNDHRHQKSFEKLNLACERLDFIYSLLKKSPLFDKIVHEPKYKKSNDISVTRRTRGNDLYIRKKEYLEALKWYTQSIAYAENGSCYMGIAYGNRSAVLFEKGYYEECLKDIERALQNNYPDNLKEKLLKRKVKAEELKPKQKPIKYYTPAPTIQNKNPCISAASESVEIRKNTKFGRHIIATRNIKVGDIISVENSFAHIVDPQSRFVHCHECLEICYNMIPCERCSAGLYCSEKCLHQSYDNYHKYECDTMPLFHKYPQLFIRIAIKGLKEYKNTEDIKLDEIYRSDRFKEVNELATNENGRDYINTCIHILIVCMSYHSLINNPNFLRDFNMDNLDFLLKDLLYRTYMIQSFNPFTIKKIKYSLGGVRSKKVGTAVYAFTSLFNHSCVPNCEFFHHGTNLLTRATANIKKGEQCTLCYGISFSTTEITLRQMTLKRNYLFDCDCKACIGKWPTFGDLPLGRSMPLWFEKKITQYNFEDTDANKRLLDELLVDALSLYNTFEKYEPCQNLLRIQNLITEIFTYMSCKDLDF